jgi:hypothetical protein
MTTHLACDPFVVEIKDGSYEVHVPIERHAFPHVLAMPDEIRSEQGAEIWLRSGTGRKTVRRVIAHYAAQRSE